MPTRIFWEATQEPGIFHVVWNSDSPFQLAKSVDEHLAELRLNGMVLEGGADIPDIGPTEKAVYKAGAYITASTDIPPVLALVSRPVTPEEEASRIAAADRETLRVDARGRAVDKLAALGLTPDEIAALLQ